MLKEFIFSTPEEARAFQAGIEYVNDGAITDIRTETRTEGHVVILDDEDARTD